MKFKIIAINLSIITPLLMFSQANNISIDQKPEHKNQKEQIKISYAFPGVEFDTKSFYFDWKNNDKNIKISLQEYLSNNDNIKGYYELGKRTKSVQKRTQICTYGQQCPNWFYSTLDTSHDNLENPFKIEGTINLAKLKENKLLARDGKGNKIDVSQYLQSDIDEKFAKYKLNKDLIEISDVEFKVGFNIDDQVVNLIFQVVFNFYPLLIKQENQELDQLLSKLQRDFNNSILDNGKFRLWWQKSFNDYSISDQWEDQENFLKQIKTKIDNFSNNYDLKKFDAYIYYKFLDDRKLAFSLKVFDKQNNSYSELPINSNVLIHWDYDSQLLKEATKNRLKIYPSKIYKDGAGLENDKVVIWKNSSTEQTKNQANKTYGGKLEFHNDVVIKFITKPDENEVLLVNGKVASVVDKVFTAKLADERIFGNGNEFKVQIIEYSQTKNKSQNQKEVKSIYEIDIIINHIPPILSITSFGWNIDDNLKDKQLISPFLLDNQGQNILDNQGNFIKNKDFNPKINIQTGVEKEIIWVPKQILPKTFADSSYQGLFNIFLNKNNVDDGFIIELNILKQAANLDLNNFGNTNNIESKIFEIDFDQNNNVQIKKLENTFADQNYSRFFSSTGNWLIQTQNESGINSFKILSIGQDENKKLANNLHENKDVLLFWNSKPGVKLFKFLKNKNLSEKQIFQLNYEQILQYWRTLVNEDIAKQTLNNNYIFNKLPNFSLEWILDKIRLVGKKQFYLNPKENKKILDTLIGPDLSSKFQITFNNIQETTDNKFNFDIIIRPLNQNYIRLYNDRITAQNANIYQLNSLLNKEKIKVNIPKFENDINTFIKELEKKNPILNILNIKFVKENNSILLALKLKPEFTKNYQLTENKHLINHQENQYVDIFKNLKLKQINLSGIDNLEQAKQFVHQQIYDNWESKNWKFEQDWNIENFYSILEKAINGLESSNTNLDKIFNLRLTTNPDSNNMIFGSKNIQLINVVANKENSSINNLSLINLEKIEIKPKNSDNIAKLIKKELKDYFLNQKVDFDSYFQISQLDKIVENFKNNPTLKSQDIVIKPLSFQVTGTKSIKVINLSNSEENNENIKTNSLIKKSDYYSLIPIGVIITLGIALLIFWLYNKFVAKFKK
ncbi:Mbov_0399 family ICE element protein [Mesomycoplasma conjunctivae]|uniref:Mbov_0399 family ICE element protein n=1 Tax=Mesomycoplasma conjunctivae TaxID=45361 RepID=UPI003DA4273A